MCKELANLYEKQLFDYVKLSEILRTQARFCDNILNQLRPEPEYFRVGFYGLSFPLFVRVSITILDNHFACKFNKFEFEDYVIRIRGKFFSEQTVHLSRIRI